MGDSMTAISLGQTAHRGRLSMMAHTAAIKFGRLTNDGAGYSVDPAQAREQFEVLRQLSPSVAALLPAVTPE